MMMHTGRAPKAIKKGQVIEVDLGVSDGIKYFAKLTGNRLAIKKVKIGKASSKKISKDNCDQLYTQVYLQIVGLIYLVGYAKISCNTCHMSANHG